MCANQQANVGRRRVGIGNRNTEWKERKENRRKRVAMGHGKKGRPSQKALSICMLERQLGRSGSAMPDVRGAFQPAHTKKRRSLPSLDRSAKAPRGTDKSSQDPGRFRSRAMTSAEGRGNWSLARDDIHLRHRGVVAGLPGHAAGRVKLVDSPCQPMLPNVTAATDAKTKTSLIMGRRGLERSTGGGGEERSFWGQGGETGKECPLRASH